jgi:hypothetical protein
MISHANRMMQLIRRLTFSPGIERSSDAAVLGRFEGGNNETAFGALIAAFVLAAGVPGVPTAFGQQAAAQQQPEATAPQAENPVSPAEPPRDKIARVDRHGDPLPEGAVLRLGTVRLRHGSGIAGIALSPDGKPLPPWGGATSASGTWLPAGSGIPCATCLFRGAWSIRTLTLRSPPTARPWHA